MANADAFRRMSGTASMGLPSRAEGQPEAVLANLEARSSGTPGGTDTPVRVGRPVNEMLGSGGYIYEATPRGYKIVKGRGGEGTVVGQDSPFYDLIQKDIALVQQRPELHKVDLLAGKKAAPKGVAVADVENVEIESAMTPAAPTPMPEMTSTAYEDALLAAPQGGKVPPPPMPAPSRSSRAPSAEPDTRGVGAGPEIARAAGKAFGDYRASVRMQSAEGQALRALVDNGMDATAARAFIQRLVDAQGEQAIPLLTSLGDPKPYVPRAQR